MFSLSNKQRITIQRSIKRINIWEGAVRSSKTWGSLVRWVQYLYNYKGKAELIIAAKTDRAILRNVIRPLQIILGSKHAKYYSGKGEAVIMGKRTFCIGANDERSEQKIRGLSSGGAYGDELTLWPESFFRMLMTRLSEEGAMFFGTTNPDTPYHYLKKDYIDNKELDLVSFHFKLQDNPFLSKTFIRNLEKEYRGLWRKRLIKGLWVVAEGSIYDCFDDDSPVHVRDVPPYTKPDYYLTGVDYGTSNPCTFLKIGVFQHGGQGYACIEDEYYYSSEETGRQKGDGQYVSDFKYFTKSYSSRNMFTVVDPSAASFIVALRQSGETNVIPADNTVLDGVRFCYNMFDEGRLMILKHCKHTREEVSSYSWNKRAQLLGIDEPLKVKDHTCDAFRYPLHTVFNTERYNTMMSMEKAMVGAKEVIAINKF